MTVERKLNTRLNQQIGLWIQRQEKSLKDEHENEFRPVVMEIVLDPKRMAGK